MDDIKALHQGFVEKRTWHKIRWIKGKYEGRFDLFTDEDLEENNNSVDIVETFKTDKCSSGPSLGFGRTTEEKINDWIRQNKR